MNVKEKLMDILAGATVEHTVCTSDGVPVSRYLCRVVAEDEVDILADYLLANGVVVREKGEWVYDHWCEFKCSKCGALSKTEPRGEENFCPNCGADMRKGENG